MKTNTNITDKVDTTLTSINAVKEVKVSPFFKEKTMQLIFNKKQEEQQVVWSWFTPKLQLATLACFVLLNVFAYLNLDTNTYEDSISDFAETYGLSEENESL